MALNPKKMSLWTLTYTHYLFVALNKFNMNKKQQKSPGTVMISRNLRKKIC